MKFKIKCFYRLSDKARMAPNITWKMCFNNFIKNFKPSSEEIIVFIDSCEINTITEAIEICTNNNFLYQVTNYGNALGFYKTMQEALKEEDNCIVYFVENDYLHRVNSKEALLEIFSVLSTTDYVTLYDHPDKYYPFYWNSTFKKYICLSELKDQRDFKSFVYYLQSGWWKTTPSTCMTFACTAKTLKEDVDILTKYTEQYGSDRPHDYKMFIELLEKGRKLFSPMPSYSCHTVMPPPGVNWVEVLNS